MNHDPHEQRKLNRMNNRPLADALGRPIKSSNGNTVSVEMNPVTQLMWPLYFNCVAQLAGTNHGAHPEAIADEAMLIAKAAMARIGFTINEKPPEPQETPA